MCAADEKLRQKQQQQQQQRRRQSLEHGMNQTPPISSLVGFEYWLQNPARGRMYEDREEG